MCALYRVEERTVGVSSLSGIFKRAPTTKIRKRQYKISIMGWFGVVRGHSKSLQIAPLDRAPTSFYQCSIVTMSLSCTVSEV